MPATSRAGTCNSRILSIHVRIHRDAGGALKSQVVSLDGGGVAGGRRRGRDVAAARFIRVIRTAGWRDAALELLEARTETVAHGDPLSVTGGRGERPFRVALCHRLAKHALR